MLGKGKNVRKGTKGFVTTEPKKPSAPTSDPLTLAKQAGSNHPVILEQARKANLARQEATANFMRERIIAEGLVDQAEKEGTSLFATTYKSLGMSVGLDILLAGIPENSGYDYRPVEPVIRDESGKPIGFIKIRKEVEQKRYNARITQYEPWVPKALWSQGLEMKALLRESDNEPEDYAEWDNSVEQFVYVHKDNATFSTDLINSGWESCATLGWQGNYTGK